MQVLTLVLNRTECLEELLEALLKSGIHGGTVVDSTGMMRVIDQSGDDLPMFAALRQLFDPERKSSKTLVMVLDDAQVAVAREVINRVTGGLDQPDTGILFAVPALFVEGMNEAMNMLLALSIAIAAGLAVSRLARLVRLPNVTPFWWAA